MKRIILMFSALLTLALYTSASTSTADVARIHVIANSDSREDIAVKLEIAEEIAGLLKEDSFDTVDGIRAGLEERLYEITAVSNGILSEKGMPYSAVAKVEKRYFDRKTLGSSAFPEGEYLSLTVTLGEGRGHNWWSVIFPGVSLEASLAMGEEGSGGRTVILGNGEIVKLRCLILDLCKFVLTKR